MIGFLMLALSVVSDPWEPNAELRCTWYFEDVCRNVVACEFPNDADAYRRCRHALLYEPLWASTKVCAQADKWPKVTASKECP